MANGQQRAEVNIAAFKAWRATQTDDDLKQIVRRGQLNRTELAKAIGCGTSALRQNPTLKKEIEKLESELRARNVLPSGAPQKDEKTANYKKQYDASANLRSLDKRRVSELEVENQRLKTENEKLRTKLAKFAELSEAMSEFGIVR